MVGVHRVPVQFMVNARARRYVLRVRPDASVRVTIPRRGSMRYAKEFLEKHLPWIERQVQRIAAAPKRETEWRVGSEILFRGELATIIATTEDGAKSVMFADQRVRITDGDGNLRPSIERHLRGLAATELVPRTFELAQQHGLLVQRVTVRSQSQRSRWGSCSRRGTISLNWRLIQAPPFVSDYIILHELTHLRQMNHSARFWAEVERVCPGFREAEKWLKGNAGLLR